MDMTKPKGEVVGSITLHFNSKMRLSHVDIADRGDLVSKRTIQDSMTLIFRAIDHQRKRRKMSGRVADAEKVKQAEDRDTSRLERYRKKVAAEKEAADQLLVDQALARKAEKDLAADKAKIPVTPGFIPKSRGISTVSSGGPKLSAEDKKAAARAEADKMLETVLATKTGAKSPAIEPVTAG